RAAAGGAGDLLEAPPEDVAEQAPGGAPQAGAEHIVRKEAFVADPGCAGQERHQRPHEADPAADEHRLSAVSLEERLDLLEALFGDSDPGSVLERKVASQAAAEQETDRVTGDAGGPRDPDQELDRERALPREHAAEDDRELARRDEADEGRRLGRRHERDQQICPLAEPGRDVLDQALDHEEAQFRRRPCEYVRSSSAQRKEKPMARIDQKNNATVRMANWYTRRNYARDTEIAGVMAHSPPN